MDYSKLINIYLNRVFTSDEVVLEADLNGVISIVKWNITDKPQPTIAQLEALIPQVEAQKNNTLIKSEIVDIELNKQLRAIREAVLNINGGVERLQAINTKIAELRTRIG